MDNNLGMGQEGNWCYEVIQVRLRKAPKFGEPYTGIVSFAINNGSLSIEGLHCDNFTVADASDIKRIAKLFGCNSFNIRRY